MSSPGNESGGVGEAWDPGGVVCGDGGTVVVDSVAVEPVVELDSVSVAEISVPEPVQAAATINVPASNAATRAVSDFGWFGVAKVTG